MAGRLATLLFGCVAILLAGCVAEGPRLTMPRATETGELTEALWADSSFTAPLTGPLGEPGAKPSPAKDDAGPWVTRAKFAWDPGHLYVLLESVGPEPHSPFGERDDLLHQADTLEVFLAVADDHRRIVEVQVNPQNVTADYLHIWRQAPTYPADRLDDDFYRANHSADIHWDVPGLRTRSVLTRLADGRTRWTAMIAIPLADILAADGLPPALRPGQTIYVNLMRYAHLDRQPGGAWRQYNLVPVRQGRPHQSPMAMAPLQAVAGSTLSR